VSIALSQSVVNVTGGMSTTNPALHTVQSCAIGGTGIWYVTQDQPDEKQRDMVIEMRQVGAQLLQQQCLIAAEAALSLASSGSSQLLPPWFPLKGPVELTDAADLCVKQHPWVFGAAVQDTVVPLGSAMCVGQLQLSSSSRPLTVTSIGDSLGLTTDVVLTQVRSGVLSHE
jgi:hypothetical protein